MTATCEMCGLRQMPNAPGVFWQGAFYCHEKCRLGAKALSTVDELIDHLRDAFSARPEVIRKVRESVMRTLEGL